MTLIYKCDHCGATFDEPGLDYEAHDELDGSPAEPYSSCPECGSGEIAEGGECRLCGGYAEKGKDYCPDCMADLKVRFELLVKCAFSPKEIEALNTIYETERFGEN